MDRRRRYQPRHPQRITSHSPVRRERGVLAWRNIVPCAAVTVLSATLIGAIWVFTIRQIHAEQAGSLARAEAVVQGQANVLAESVRQELNTIDQSLAILRTAWNSDPNGFSLKSWQSRMPAITAVAKDIFISNNKGMIVQDILPQAVGQGVGSAYVDVGYGSLESVQADNQSGRHPGLVIDQKVTDGIVRRYLMYVLRPLAKPAGWWIGASYRSSALVKVFAEGSLGSRGIAALIDTRVGGVQAVAGPAALRPVPSIAKTAMYEWIEQQKADSGIWIGPTPMDQAVRIQAYRRIPQRGLIVLAGVDKADWMSASNLWARNARIVAGLGSALVAGLGGLVLLWLWRLDSRRRWRFALDQAGIQLNSAQSGLQVAELAARTSLAQVQAFMAAGSDGIALFDAEWRLAAWNAPFSENSGLPPGFLRIGRPVDEVFRQQAQAGLFGALRDIEAEITERLSQLRTGTDLASFAQRAPDGRMLAVRGCSMPDGGMMLIVTGGDAPSRHQLAVAPPQGEPAPEPQAIEGPPVEW